MLTAEIQDRQMWRGSWRAHSTVLSFISNHLWIISLLAMITEKLNVFLLVFN